MYPYEIIFGLDLYTIMLCAGIFACILLFGKLADRARISMRLQRICYITAVFAITLGYGSAVLFQAFYNIKRNGGFVLNSETGATFYGGLIGGVCVFLLIYFVAGHFMFSDGYHKKSFWKMSGCASASIAIAHGMGRIGCLMAGCCHGRQTDKWYGIVMNGEKYVPLQLYEAIFLFCLMALLIILVYRGIYCGLAVYAVSYGVWRFFIEYARGDYRGSTFISFLSPSQATAIIFVLVGIALFFIQKHYCKALRERSEQESADDEA